MGRAVEQDDCVDGGFVGGVEVREIGGVEFDGEVAIGAEAGGVGGEFGEERGGGIAKADEVGRADDGACGMGADEGGAVVGDVSEAVEGAGEGEGGFAGAGIAAEQESAAVTGDAGGVEGEEMAGLDEGEGHGFEEVVTKIFGG